MNDAMNRISEASRTNLKQRDKKIFWNRLIVKAKQEVLDRI